MRILSLVLLTLTGLFSTLSAQGGVDIANARANPKTFIFDDGRHTVHGFIYKQLEEQTSCCGNDGIYLEVKFDASGTVTSAKTLTGKNECYKNSVVDIVKMVKWDATGVSGSKTIYFEVKPIIPCSGSPGENTYQAIASAVGSGTTQESSTVSTVTEVEEVEEVVEEVEEVVADVVEEEVEEVEEVVEEVEEVVMEEVEETVAVVEEVEEDVVEETNWGGDDGFLSDGGVSSTSSQETVVEEVEETPIVSETISSRRNNTNPAPTASTGPVSIPPQADLDYVSKGERSPAEEHNETFYNGPGQSVTIPRYQDGEQALAVHIRKQLKSSGYCGLAQAAFELTISPSGEVIETRILAVNNEKIKDVIPGIVQMVKFQSASYARNYRSIHQFKAYIRCGEEKPAVDLDAVPNMIEPVASN